MASERGNKMANFVKDCPRDNVLLVDAMNLAFRWKNHGKSHTSSQLTKFAEEFVATIESLARSYNAGQIIVAADMKGSSYRRELYPDYKGNRKDAYKDQTSAEKKESELFFNEYERCLELADKRFLLLRYEGVEADDIAAYIVTRRRWYGISQIWLISSDRDWDLLIKPDVHRFSTVTRKEITLETWPYEVPPEQYLCYKCLTGDPGDNIPGVPKVGPKTAAKLLAEWGSSFEICDAIPLPGKYVYIQNVNASKDQILLNHELMDLETYCEEAIGSENIRDIGTQLMLNERKL
jgi:5'-3' exonuclease